MNLNLAGKIKKKKPRRFKGAFELSPIGRACWRVEKGDPFHRTLAGDTDKRIHFKPWVAPTAKNI